MEKILNKKNLPLAVSVIFVFLAGIFAANYVFLWQFGGFENSLKFASEHFEIYFYSAKITLILAILFWAIFKNPFISTSIFYIFLTVAMFINSEKMRSRNLPFTPDDFAMSTEVGSLSSMVNFSNLLFALAVILTIFLAGFFASKFFKKLPAHNFSKKFTIPLRIFTVFAMIFLLNSSTIFLRSELSSKGTFVRVDWLNSSIDFTNVAYNYSSNGFIVGTISSLQTEIQKKPANYSKENVEKIVAKYEKIAREINASRNDSEKFNVIFVMSESFVDPNLAKHAFDFGEKDPIEFTRALANSQISGNSVTDEYGGGTANVEFEALTGLSNYFINGIPYSAIVAKNPETPSLAKFFKQKNYTTTAIHPYADTMYRRNVVYPNLGFENFIAGENSKNPMKNQQKIDNSKYISDDSAFSETFETLKKTEKTDFVHLVTMQNHMPYENGVYNSKNFPIKNSAENSDARQWEIYLEGLKHSDEALRKFIEKIDNFDEKTVVVFWGDHWPGIASALFQNQKNPNDLRHTPFFIYKNFGKSSEKIGDISPNFFQSELLKAANSKISPFQALLFELRKKIPALTHSHFDGAENSVLTDYEMIEYDILNGEKFSKNGFFEAK